MEWLAENVEWIFSGIGIAIGSGVWALFSKKRNKKKSESKKSQPIHSNTQIYIQNYYYLQEDKVEK